MTDNSPEFQPIVNSSQKEIDNETTNVLSHEKETGHHIRLISIECTCGKATVLIFCVECMLTLITVPSNQESK